MSKLNNLHNMKIVKWLLWMNKAQSIAFNQNKTIWVRKVMIMITSFKLKLIQDYKIWKITLLMVPHSHQTCNKLDWFNQNILKKIRKWFMKNYSHNLILFNQIYLQENFKTSNSLLKLRTRKTWWKKISFSKRRKSIQIAHLTIHSNRKLICCIRKVSCKIFYPDWLRKSTRMYLINWWRNKI